MNGASAAAPRVLRPVRLSWVHALLLATAALVACASNGAPADGTPEASGSGPTGSGPGDRAAPQLPRTHAEVRAFLGPHRMAISTTVRVHRTGDPPGTPLSVADRWEIAWSPDALSLIHRNDHDRGHELRILGKRAYVRLPHRPWYETSSDTVDAGPWLDEAVASVSRILEWIGPAGELSPAGEAAGRYALLPTQAPARDGRRYTSIDGRLDLGNDGIPRRFDLEASFTQTVSGAEVQGRMEVHMTLTEVSAADLEIRPPEGAIPYPEKQRIEPDRRALLEGLAPLPPPR